MFDESSNQGNIFTMFVAFDFAVQELLIFLDEMGVVGSVSEIRRLHDLQQVLDGGFYT